MSAGESLGERAAGEITRERILEVMDIMGDTNPIHSDEALVARLGMRGLVNQGPANLSYAVNLLVDWAGDPAAFRTLRFRFHTNVVPGDRLTARGHVTGTAAVGDETHATVAFSLDFEDGSPAVSGTATIARDA